jgi:hypothetical protein
MDMTAKKKITAITLIFALLVSGLPLWRSDDANRDGRTDLMDMILLVKDFAVSAQEPAGFVGHVEDLISAITVVAGLKTALRSPRDSDFQQQLPFSGLPFLIPSHGFFDKAPLWSHMTETDIAFTSITIPPALPPPMAWTGC